MLPLCLPLLSVLLLCLPTLLSCEPGPYTIATLMYPALPVVRAADRLVLGPGPLGPMTLARLDPAPGPLGGMTLAAKQSKPDCPYCDSSVFPYCSDKLLHDACCCLNPYESSLPPQCQLADCSFLHANSCKEHRLITRCCCDRLLYIKR